MGKYERLFRSLPRARQVRIQKTLREGTPLECEAILSELDAQVAAEEGVTPEDLLRYDWAAHAKPHQLAPEGDWQVFLLLAGRGAGKTRSICEWARDQVENHGRRRGAIVAATAADARDVLVEGESGILSVCPPWNRPIFEPSKRRVTWPNGAILTTYSADEPDRLRGPQHDFAIADEIAAWRTPEAFDQLLLGLRLGKDPRLAIATTPRPTKIIKELLAAPTTVTSRFTTYANRENLAPAFFERVVKKYEGTRLGRQEIEAEILEDTPGALWSYDLIDRTRVKEAPEEMVRIVIGVDPSGGSSESSAKCGIVAAGLGPDGHGYVLSNRSLRATPHVWASAVVSAYQGLSADRIIAEKNFGGEMVESTIRTVDKNASVKVVTASRGKMARAEPVSALFEQGRAHLVGVYPDLEEQMTSWVPGEPNQDSPDEMDAMVWALTELMVRPEKREIQFS